MPKLDKGDAVFPLDSWLMPVKQYLYQKERE